MSAFQAGGQVEGKMEENSSRVFERREFAVLICGKPGYNLAKVASERVPKE
jgi:hypothetical protein